LRGEESAARFLYFTKIDFAALGGGDSGQLDPRTEVTPTSRRHCCAKPSFSSPLKGEEAITDRPEEALNDGPIRRNIL
jgi:hypothetical protein